LGIHSVYNNNFKYFRKQWLVKYGCYGCQAQGRGLIPLCVCVCVCVCACARIRFGKYGRNLDSVEFFFEKCQFASFSGVRDENFPVRHTLL
jgi:hypothetical protein